MKLTIHITKDILKRSMFCSSKIGGSVGQNCAIGLAIFDLFGDRSWVCADEIILSRHKIHQRKDGLVEINGTVFSKDQAEICVVPLCKEAQNFIMDFDFSSAGERLYMQPISFDVEIPDVVIDWIKVEDIDSIIANCPTLDYALV